MHCLGNEIESGNSSDLEQSSRSFTLQVFSNGIFRPVVQQLTRFQLTVVLHGPPAIAKPRVHSQQVSKALHL